MKLRIAASLNAALLVACSQPSTPATAPVPTAVPVEPAFAAEPEPPQPPKPGVQWRYETKVDAMGRGEIQIASVRSTNEFEFGPPYGGQAYGGSQRAWLALRKHPQAGKDVIIKIERGQFKCDLRGCGVLVRFDDGKAARWEANEPTDNSSETLFISPAPRFMAQAKKANVVRIEALFFQEGTRVLEFDTSGLQWD